MASPKARLLVVDDEQSMREFLESFLRREGYDVSTAADVNTALSYLESDEIDLVITDMQMPEKTGLDLILEARELSPETAMIVVTGFGTTDGAISAMREGACAVPALCVHVEPTKRRLPTHMSLSFPPFLDPSHLKLFLLTITKAM